MKIRSIALLGLITCSTLCAHASGVIVYTDRASWQTAAGGGVGDLFDNMNSGTIVGETIDRTNYTITGTALGAFPNFNSQTTVDGTGYLRAFLNGTDGGNYITFTFNSGILALGYDFNPQPSDVGSTISLTVDGFLQGFYHLPASDVNGFMGFVFDEEFTTLDIATANDSAWHGIDNLEAFHAIPVPEPTAAALSLFGLAVVLMKRRANR